MSTVPQSSADATVKLAAWKCGKPGTLSPWQQAVALAMIQVSASWNFKISYSQVARRVEKIGGGHPSKQAIAQLHAASKSDIDWYPEKVDAGAMNKEVQALG